MKGEGHSPKLRESTQGWGGRIAAGTAHAMISLPDGWESVPGGPLVAGFTAGLLHVVAGKYACAVDLC